MGQKINVINNTSERSGKYKGKCKKCGAPITLTFDNRKFIETVKKYEKMKAMLTDDQLVKLGE